VPKAEVAITDEKTRMLCTLTTRLRSFESSPTLSWLNKGTSATRLFGQTFDFLGKRDYLVKAMSMCFAV